VTNEVKLWLVSAREPLEYCKRKVWIWRWVVMATTCEDAIERVKDDCPAMSPDAKWTAEESAEPFYQLRLQTADATAEEKAVRRQKDRSL
jgi:hypothetical protein